MVNILYQKPKAYATIIPSYFLICKDFNKALNYINEETALPTDKKEFFEVDIEVVEFDINHKELSFLNIEYIHKTKQCFRDQQHRDKLKRKLCAEHGVVLIEVPYTVKKKTKWENTFWTNALS